MAAEKPARAAGLRPTLRTSRAPGWALLGTLLALTVIAATMVDRGAWSRPLAGEATYLMQAESLAFDLDLAFTRADFDRFVVRAGGEPTDLALASDSDGRRIAYDRPFVYAAVLAPFVRRWPRGGFAVANALLLALAAVAAARTLERQLGNLAPALVAVMAFASVTFAYVFLATGDLFLLVTTVLACCLLVRPAAPRSALALAGLLLAVPAATYWLYLALPLALIAFAGRGRRGPLLAGLALGVIGCALVQWLGGGGLGGLSGSRFAFTPETGFPLVDFPAESWRQSVRELNALHWQGAPRLSWGFDLRLLFWNLLYLLFGRHIGVLPYLLPLVVVACCGAFSGLRRGIVVAAGVTVAALLIARPFDLYGGPGAIGNRLLLPVYGALWLVLARRRWALAAVPVALTAALFLAPLWRAPWEEPLGPDGYRHAATAAARALPYETSQRWLPGGARLDHRGLWLRALNRHVWGERRKGRMMVDGAQRAELMVISAQPLDVVRLDFGAEAPSQIEVTGARLAERLLQPDGRIAFRLAVSGLRPRHPLWWTPRRQYLYRLGFRLPAATGALPFTVVGERRQGEGSGDG